MVLGGFGVVVGSCGSFWMVLGDFQTFWLVPQTNFKHQPINQLYDETTTLIYNSVSILCAMFYYTKRITSTIEYYITLTA